MKDGLPRPISQQISLKDAVSVGSPVASSYTGTVPVFNEFDDFLTWKWTASVEYSTGSLYKVLNEGGRINWGFMKIWEVAVPLKVKFFSQLLLKEKLPTRVMLQSRGVNCDIHCVMCKTGAVETSKHLFFECQNATGIWARFVNLMQVGDSACDTWNASQNFHCSNMGGNKQIDRFGPPISCQYCGHCGDSAMKLSFVKRNHPSGLLQIELQSRRSYGCSFVERLLEGQIV